MSTSTSPFPEAAPPAASVPPDLAALRAELDRMDDALHDVLRARAEVVARVGRLKAGVALRPGREAAILRRLLAAHDGALPPWALVRIWREMFAATTAMQGHFLISVCEIDPGNGVTACAREHFGALTPLHAYHSAAQAIGEVSAGSAAAAVLPLPAEEDEAGSWWTALMQRDDPRIYVVARLPFWAPRPEGTPRIGALVVSAAAPDPSGDDRTLIGLELPPDLSRTRLAGALAAAGLETSQVVIRRLAGGAVVFALIDVAGFVAEDDPRLVALPGVLRPPVVLGAYAIPLGDVT